MWHQPDVIRVFTPCRTNLVVFLILVTMLAVTAPGAGGAQAATLFADAARPDDSGTGLSWETAKQTIAAAIAASAAGDTILVKYGSYPIGDALVLTSDRCLGSDDGTHNTWEAALPDYTQCVVAADQTCRVLTISGAAVTATTRIRGLTFTGGRATNEGDPNNPYGGGVDISSGADLTLEDCRITANVAGTTFNGRGGGLSVRGAGTAVVVRDCRIDDNTATTSWYAYGGGVYAGTSAVLTLDACVISGNRGSTGRVGGGGGIACEGATVDILDCEIVGNVASTQSSGVGGNGGGVYVSGGVVEILGCAITDNEAAQAQGGQGTGGGIYLSGASGTRVVGNPAIARNVASVRGRGFGGGISSESGQTIQDNVIEENIASTSESTEYQRYGAGGGVIIRDSNTSFTGNLIRGNVASLHGEGRGGGIYYESTNAIERNVIWNNVASASTPGYGGGIYTEGGYHTSLRNNTVVHNANVTIAGGAGGGSGFYAGGAGSYVENNIFCDHDVPGSDGIGFYSAAALTIGYNGFADNAGGNVGGPVTSQFEVVGDPRFVDPAAGDFHLSYDSPGIESGNPATPVPANGGWVVDQGAFEYTGTRHRRAIPGPGLYLFGGRVRAKVNLVDAGTLTEIDMVVHPGEQHPQAPGSVARYYAITAVGEDPLFDLTLSYLDEELGDQNENDLALWRRTGFTWEGPKIPIAADPAANWLTAGGQTAFSDWAIAEDLSLVAVGEGAPASRAELLAIYPNPFNPNTRIAYRLPRAAAVQLAVYDPTGRLVRVLVDEVRQAGEQTAVWDGTDAHGRQAASGLYLVKLRCAGQERQIKALLLK